MSDSVTSIVLAGLGGQGVIKASDILAEAAFFEGLDVKKAEVHGMSQRGGSVHTDVRFGSRVYSPMVPPGEADFLVVLSDDQVDNNRARLRPGGVLVVTEAVRHVALPSRKCLNVALLGHLSRGLPLSERSWEQAIRANFQPSFHAMNLAAFHAGRAA